ncbi:MAG: peptide-methionine (S)-S-oxide reductase MsrA [Planctomycetota bacterium]|nr:peptide-methionine (S)-S-oxide reductase MsrA [Planctomycetota bacterium]
MSNENQPTREVATLGAGCYWCVEAVLQQVDGVLALRSGFMGGDVEDPSYEAVCMGVTGHAEVVEVTFDPSVLSYRQLLAWFWRLHNPTTLNQQGADHGTQYRSVIFTHSASQAADAAESLRIADASGVFPAPIVTEVCEASTFFEAKAEHQDFYRRNSNQGYCHMVIRPKLQRLGLDY